MSVVDVVVVGAGFAGLGMVDALRRAGRDDVVVIERAGDVGGTWRDNTYPGVACDVPAHLYSYAAHPHAGWSRTFAEGHEIQQYLRDVAAGLGDRIRLNTPLIGAEWDADTSVWHIDTGAATLRARSLVLACGRLTEPHVPAIDGLESFPGPLFHSARWDHAVDLTDRNVAVVGTGASAVQLVPELARRAAHVTLFQRTPAWIVPRGGGEIPAAERERLADDPGALARLRAELYAEGEARFASRSGDVAAASAARDIALAHLHAQVSDPAMRAALTPDYAFGCKRVLLSDAFYPAVASDRVTLEPTALDRVDGSTLTAASGRRHEADVLVLATGFASTQQPYADLVRGDDETLAEHWSTGMTSFGSTVVAGFPNLFVLNGPNASLGHNSAVLMAEEQAAYVVRALCERDRRPERVLRVRPEAEAAYTDEIAAAAASTPWLTGGCRNWYVDERSGRLTLLWPGTVQAFRERLTGADGSEFEPAHTPVRGEASPRARPVRDPRRRRVMSVPLRFGYKASSEQFGPNELLDFGVLAEEMGFDSVFLSDHLQPWRHEGGHAPNALPWLGALGARTQRVMLGTSVLTPTFRYHPGVIAQVFATLGVMFPGRVALGVGTGEALNEVTLGLDWPEPPERFQRLKEAITLIDKLWTEDRVTFEGTYYSVKDATIYDRPEQKVPIYIGASGPAATRLAGRIAEGYITTSGKDPELYTEKLLPALDDGLGKAGRTRDDVDTLMEVKVSYHPDHATALEKTRFWAPLALSAEEKMSVHDPLEMQRLADELPIERAASRFIVSTDPDEHVERIAHYVDLGFRHLVFHDPGHDQEEFLRTYGSEILPRLRKRFA